MSPSSGIATVARGSTVEPVRTRRPVMPDDAPRTPNGTPGASSSGPASCRGCGELVWLMMQRDRRRTMPTWQHRRDGLYVTGCVVSVAA